MGIYYLYCYYYIYGIGVLFWMPWGIPIAGERSFRYKPYSHAGRSYERYVVFIKISQEIRSQRTSLVPRLLTAANCLNRKNLSPCFCSPPAEGVRPHTAYTILSRPSRMTWIQYRLYAGRSYEKYVVFKYISGYPVPTYLSRSPIIDSCELSEPEEFVSLLLHSSCTKSASTLSMYYT